MPGISSSRSTVREPRGIGAGCRRSTPSGWPELSVPSPAPGRRARASGIAASSCFDAGGEGVDLGGQRVDLVEQHPGEFGVVVVEAAVSASISAGALGLHPAAGQVGEPPRVAFPGDQRLDHVARRQRVQRRRPPTTP